MGWTVHTIDAVHHMSPNHEFDILFPPASRSIPKGVPEKVLVGDKTGGSNTSSDSDSRNQHRGLPAGLRTVLTRKA